MEPRYPALRGRRICLVTSGPVGSNPRIVKEANALSAHGAEVTVVSLDVTGLEHIRARNASVLADAAWRCVLVPRDHPVLEFLRALSHKLARRLFAWGIRPHPLVVHAANRHSLRLGREAARVPADLYIAHNLGALPAAFRAAGRHQARLGFDAEDFHAGELPEGEAWEGQRRLIQAVEARCLPRCEHLTAASPGIARAYAALYGIPEPRTILNVFPRAEAPEGWTERGEAAPGPSMYWFSQTIGPDRGLEEAVRAMGSAAVPIHLHLRGSVSQDYRDGLIRLASACGVADRLHFLPRAAPQDMARLAARHDLGLAPETLATPNSRILWSNKVFTYLLAGLPTLGSATPGQGELASRAGGALRLYPPGDHVALARLLEDLLVPAGRLARERRRAWELGQDTFNWDQEQHAFLGLVHGLFAQE